MKFEVPKDTLTKRRPLAGSASTFRVTRPTLQATPDETLACARRIIRRPEL